MGLSGCYSMMKYLVLLVNLIFWLLGIAVIALSVWMLTDPTFYVRMAQDETSYHTGLYIFLAVGLLMFVVGFLGCCGAYRESPCMLVTFFCFLLIIVVAEIAAVVWAYSNSDKLEVYVERTVRSTVQEEYGIVDTRTKTFDAIQEGLQCCGVTGPRDWAGSKFNKAGKGALDLGVSSVLQIYRVPRSCCRYGIDENACTVSMEIGLGAQIASAIYSEGCVSKLIDTLKNHMSIVIGVGIGIGIIECLGLIFSLILCCGIRNMDRYKA